MEMRIREIILLISNTGLLSGRLKNQIPKALKQMKSYTNTKSLL